jgi:hypothetical protein
VWLMSNDQDPDLVTFLVDWFDPRHRPRRHIGDFTRQTGIDPTRFWRIRHGDQLPTEEECSAIAREVGLPAREIIAMSQRIPVSEEAQLRFHAERIAEMSEELRVEARQISHLMRRLQRHRR